MGGKTLTDKINRAFSEVEAHTKDLQNYIEGTLDHIDKISVEIESLKSSKGLLEDSTAVGVIEDAILKKEEEKKACIKWVKVYKRNLEVEKIKLNFFRSNICLHNDAYIEYTNHHTGEDMYKCNFCGHTY